MALEDGLGAFCKECTCTFGFHIWSPDDVTCINCGCLWPEYADIPRERFAVEPAKLFVGIATAQCVGCKKVKPFSLFHTLSPNQPALCMRCAKQLTPAPVARPAMLRLRRGDEEHVNEVYASENPDLFMEPIDAEEAQRCHAARLVLRELTE